MLNWKLLTHDAGGPWLGYLRAYLWVAPLWVVSSLLFTPLPNEVMSIWLLFVANCVGVGVAIFLTAFLNVTAFRHRSDRPIDFVVVIAGGAFVGASKGLTTNLFLVWVEHVPLNTQDLLSKTVLIAVMGAWLMPTIAVIYAARERLESERVALINELVQAEFAHYSNQSDRSFSQLTDRPAVDEFISTAQQQLTAARGVSPAEYARIVKSLVDNELRPLSRQLWQRASSEVSTFSFSALLKVMWNERNYSPLLTSAAYALLFCGPQIAYAGWGVGLARVTFQCLIIWFILLIAQRITVKSTAAGAALYVAVNLVLVFLIQVLSTSLFGALPGYPPVQSVLLLMYFFFVVGLVFGIFRAAISQRSVVREKLHFLVERQPERIIRDFHQESQRRELAHYLHSHVQNTMLSSALRVSELSTTQSNLVEEELTGLLRMVDSIMGNSHPLSYESFDEMTSRIHTEWVGILDFKLSVINPQKIPVDRGALVYNLGLILTEAITNASRHGQATSVSIIIEVLDSAINISCTADGKEPTQSSPGLGFGLFTLFAGSSWSLIASDNQSGSVLHLTLKLEDPAKASTTSKTT